MACAYAFAIVALVSLPAAIQTGQTIVIVGWVAQTFLQLVLLSIIMVGQKVLAAAGDERTEHVVAVVDRIAAAEERILGSLNTAAASGGLGQEPDMGTQAPPAGRHGDLPQL